MSASTLNPATFPAHVTGESPTSANYNARWSAVVAAVNNHAGLIDAHIDIRSFGATGNGSTDDTAAIQAALNVGGRVYIPPVTPGLHYKITAPLVISKPTQLFGMGAYSQIFASSAFTASDDLLRIIPTDSSRSLYSLSNFVLGAAASSRHMVHVDLTTVSGTVGLAAFDMDRMYLNPSTNGKAFKLTNPTITEGFLLSSIRGCIIYGGVHMERCGDSVIISENSFNGSNIGIELSFTTGAAQCVIEKNNMVSAGGAIVLHNAIQPKILHNQIEQLVAYTGAEAASIALKGDTAQIASAHIQGNNINTLGNVTNCISVQAATNTRIENNDMVSAGTHVLIGSSALRTHISQSNKFQNLSYVFIPMSVTDYGNSTSGPYINEPTSIRDLGATGYVASGLNSTTAIQAALDIGGDVYIPPLPLGDYYRVTAPLLIWRPVRLFGVGINSQILGASSFSATDDVIRIIPAAGTLRNQYALERFSLGVEGYAGRHGVHIDLTTVSDLSLYQFDMDRVYIYQGGGYSLRLTNPTNANGFYTSSIRGCAFNSGVFMQRAGNNVILSENTIAGTNCGIDLSFVAGTGHCVIEKNNITSAGGAIKLQSGTGTKILRNIIAQTVTYTGTEAACVALSGNTSQLAGCEVRGNAINTQGLVTYAIDVQGANDTLIAENDLVAATTHIRVGAAAARTIISPVNRAFNTSYVLVAMAVTNTGTATAGPLITPTFQNSWIEADATNFPVRFSKNNAGIVTVQGAVKDGTATAGLPIFTLPTGFTPFSTDLRFIVPASVSGAFDAGVILVTAAGQVQYWSGTNVEMHLAFSFKAGG